MVFLNMCQTRFLKVTLPHTFSSHQLHTAMRFRNTFTLVSVGLVIGCISVVGCDAGGAAAADAVAVRTSEGTHLLVGNDVLAAQFEDVTTPDPSDPRKRVDVDITSFSLLAGDAHSYLVGTGKTEDGRCFTMARELEKRGDRLGPMTDGQVSFLPEGNTCTSMEGCQGCSFVRNSGGRITGCNCNTSGLGWCSHTVSEG